jgi:hypothetical protein
VSTPDSHAASPFKQRPSRLRAPAAAAPHLSLLCAARWSRAPPGAAGSPPALFHPPAKEPTGGSWGRHGVRDDKLLLWSIFTSPDATRNAAVGIMDQSRPPAAPLWNSAAPVLLPPRWALLLVPRDLLSLFPNTIELLDGRGAGDWSHQGRRPPPSCCSGAPRHEEEDKRTVLQKGPCKSQ